MNEVQERAIAAITAQQPKERTDVWMVGEQLKDICRAEPHTAELIEKDMAVKGMGLADAAKKMKEYADAHKTGSFACVTPAESDRILRDFYGLSRETPAAPEKETGKIIDLADFL